MNINGLSSSISIVLPPSSNKSMTEFKEYLKVSDISFNSSKGPLISPEKIVELLSLMMSTPDIVKNHTGNILDLRV